MLGLIITLIVVGLIAGAVARLLVPGRQSMSILTTIVIGIVGSFVGGFLGYLLFGKDSFDGFLQPPADRLDHRGRHRAGRLDERRLPAGHLGAGGRLRAAVGLSAPDTRPAVVVLLLAGGRARLRLRFPGGHLDRAERELTVVQRGTADAAPAPKSLEGARLDHGVHPGARVGPAPHRERDRSAAGVEREHESDQRVDVDAGDQDVAPRLLHVRSRARTEPVTRPRSG